MGRSRRLAVDDGSWAYRFEFFNDPVAPTLIDGFRNIVDYVELDTSGSGDDPLYSDAFRISPPHLVVWAKGLVSFDVVTERQAIFMAVANANTLFSRFPGTGTSIGYIDPATYDTIAVGARQDERSIGKFRYFEASVLIEFKDTINFSVSKSANVIEGVLQPPASIAARPAQAFITDGTSLDNIMNASAAAQTINGLGGNDTITVNAAGCDVDGGAGNDTILGAQANCNLFGGDNDDTITAGEANYVEGGNGNDTIIASGLNTTVGYFDGGAGFDRAVMDFSGFGSNITITLRSDGGNTHLVQSEFATFAYVDIEAVTISGGSGADTLTGSDTADTLNGNGGQDTLDGGTGADIMNGGADSDTYYVDNAADRVIESGPGVAGGTADTIFTSVSYILLARYIETMTLTGTDPINATGNSLANTLNGNSANNVIDGLGGADRMAGGLGNDTYVVDNIGDRVVESSIEGTADVILSSVSYTLLARYIETMTLTGTDPINATGNSLANTLNGNSANNVIDGMGGADRMAGGLGNDTYVVDNTGDVVTEGSTEGTADVILSSVSYTLLARYIETLILTGGDNINATGNSLANVLTGNSGANTLTGLGGADVLNGGAGTDILDGGDGTDTATYAGAAGAVTVSLAIAGAQATGGAGSDTLIGIENLTGSALADTLTGNTGANVIDGGVGADTMAGGDGGDTYYVDTTSDNVIDGPTGGTTDTVFASASYLLAGRFIETLILTGATSINGSGNSMANTLTGNTAANVLTGFGGSDTISGGAGADTLLGGDGLDTLTGGGDADQFRFQTALAGHADTITDFVHGTDRIGFSAAAFGLAAGALSAARFSGTGAATAATGQFVYSAASNTLSWDADGTSSGSAVLLATLNASAGLTLGDLFVF